MDVKIAYLKFPWGVKFVEILKLYINSIPKYSKYISLVDIDYAMVGGKLMISLDVVIQINPEDKQEYILFVNSAELSSFENSKLIEIRSPHMRYNLKGKRTAHLNKLLNDNFELKKLVIDSDIMCRSILNLMEDVANSRRIDFDTLWEKRVCEM